MVGGILPSAAISFISFVAGCCPRLLSEEKNENKFDALTPSQISPGAKESTVRLLTLFKELKNCSEEKTSIAEFRSRTDSMRDKLIQQYEEWYNASNVRITVFHEQGSRESKSTDKTHSKDIELTTIANKS
jgi:hypothetical protein